MPSHRCCNGFTRSQFLVRSAARAGQGLPQIEPGMPAPAGTGLSRRSFVVRSAGLAISVYGGMKLAPQALEEGIAQAASGPAQPVLVSIFLEGGADSLSILAPTGDPKYAQLRPTLAFTPDQGTAFSEDSRLRWTPSVGSLATLHGEGKVTVFPAVGYDHPDQSHFTSRHYWEVGALDTRANLGWMGRFLDAGGNMDNPLQGLSLDYNLAPALASRTVPVAAVDSPDSYDFWSRNVWDPVAPKMLDTFGGLGNLPAGDGAMKQARTATRNVGLLRSQLASLHDLTTPAGYPNTNFAKSLAALVAMLAAGLPLKCVTLSAPGGYDTHSDQAGDLATNLQATTDAILAFQRDLEAKGLADRVLTQLWSEFGRRPEENGSKGTDHGAAGTAFLIGTRTTGRMVGEFPGLGTLDDDDNLRVTSDFRGMYCALLEQWFGTDAGEVIPGASGFSRPTLVK